MHPLRLLLFPIFTLLVLGSGCATHKPSPANISAPSYAIIEAQGQPTTVQVEIRTPFRWEGAQRGALEGIGNCANVRVEGGAEALAQLLLCIPVSGVLGAIAGYIAEPSPPPTRLDELEAFIGNGQPQTLIKQYTLDYVKGSGGRISDNPQQLVTGTYVELWLKAVNIKARAYANGVNVAITLDVRVRMLNAESDKQIRTFTIKRTSQNQGYQSWLLDDYASVHEFVRGVARHLGMKLLDS